MSASKKRVGCPSGKLAYRGRAAAGKAAAMAAARPARRAPHRGGRMTVYKCPDCGHWHLASDRRRK